MKSNAVNLLIFRIGSRLTGMTGLMLAGGFTSAGRTAFDHLNQLIKNTTLCVKFS
jgi:hypothetical protein